MMFIVSRKRLKECKNDAIASKGDVQKNNIPSFF
jgi:hypothetical protein